MENPEWSGIQLYRYTEYNLSMVGILFLMIFNYCKSLERKTWQLTGFKYKLSSKYIDFTNISRPLFNIDSLFMIEWILYLLMSLGIFYFKLGRHDGSWLVYIHHLISPFLIIIVLQFISKQKLGKFILVFLLFLNLFCLTKPDFLQGSQSDNNAWEDMKILISQHNNILNSPAIVPLLIDQGKPIYDSGLTEYFQYSIKRNLFGINLPDEQLAKDRNDQLMQKVANTIESKGFDLITMTNHYSLFVSEDNLQKYYQYKKTITVPMASSFQNWKLDIWEPKS
jgi:hypothetical protein